MKASLLLVLLLVLGTWQRAAAQTPIDTTGGRYFRPIFPTVTVTTGVVYGNTTNPVFNTAMPLLMDVYQPAGDLATERPVIIFAHEGGFVRGTRNDAYMTAVCTQFAKLGYVTASIDYRLLFFPLDTTNVSRAAIRGMQDMRAAVRFFREDAATANVYKVSPSRIVVGGASAGGFMALQVAYLDKASEVTSDVNLAALGGIEGNSGHAGYNSFPLAVLNLSGATNPPAIIEPGNAPLYSAHGTADAVVPYLKGRVGAGLPPKYVFGSGLLNPYASSVGVPNVLRRFSKAPHIPQYPVQSADTGSPNSAAYADTTYRDIRAFLRPLLAPFVALPSLVINTNTTVAPGAYQDITINSGTATLSGNVTVYGTLVIKSQSGQPAGALNTNCFVVDGPGNFDLQAGGALRICDVDGISASGATGAVRNTGARSFSNDAVYVYNGTADQVTGTGLPTTARELEIAVPLNNRVTLTRAVSIRQRYVPTSGLLDNRFQTVTLLSGPSGTALVGPGAGTQNNLVTVQLYLDPSVNPGLGYRHIAPPVASATTDDLATPAFTPIINPAYNTSTRPDLVRPFPNVFGYEQSRILLSTATVYSTFDRGWFVPVSRPGAPNYLPGNHGYAVNITAGQTLSFTGALLANDRDISFTLTGAVAADAGWHLLGSPFASALDWDNVTLPTGMSSAMYIFVSTSQYAGNYRAYVNGVGGAGRIIPLGQGFFVRSLSPNPVTFTFPVSARVPDFATSNTATLQRTATDTRPQLRLTLAAAATPATTDEAYVYQQAGATNGVDAAFDAVKLPNPSGLNLATLAAGQQLAINGLPVVGAPTTVPLDLGVPSPGAYVLTADQLANYAPGALVLTDALTGTRTPLAAGTRYAFTLVGTTAPGRFALELSAGVLATSPAQALAAQLQVYPNPASGSFHVMLPLPAGAVAPVAVLTNALGQTVRRLPLSATAGSLAAGEVNVRGLAPGVYQLHLTVAGTALVRRVVVE
ncbi:alpha/beta hydrolase fold domain-containing protein [Hymenobacter properus]|uniref:Alpha/beta hydrolase fold domain-containing protein n=1 Tax=Hymenobacter properus TaxID=2791026 RepID=A0A931BJ04_9BACT|nr:alpha/beta hydrolase fold domain-containing protein [Hymenobacter properus]MBF9143183.1 alpha/beta hydrolase fold domain-containing protein [Hymenobacter properus]MBR7721991.1 alpha/beta hydrolase fold domain-containing protein [Microvirga sp. SRT04]